MKLETKLENYRIKIKTLVSMRELINEKLEKLNIKRAKDYCKGIFDQATNELCNTLQAERFDIDSKLFKVSINMENDGFEINDFCVMQNYYLDLYKKVKEN